MSNAAFASTEELEAVTDDLINKYGVFDGETGIVYAKLLNFADYPSLVIVSVREEKLMCEVYDNIDGIQCTDVLALPISTDFTLSEINNGKNDLIMLKEGHKNIFYTISCDAFEEEYNTEYIQKTDIIGSENGKLRAYSSKRSLYNFINGLKAERIKKYKTLNSINTVSDAEKEKILKTVKACADIMDFDINEFDYNTLVRYILCTNQNFGILTDIQPQYTADSGGLSVVSVEYIDNILSEVFDIQPRHPAVNSLLSCGFCTDNGYYYYKNIFTEFYATDVMDIAGIYHLGNEIYYVVFRDIYRQGSVSFPEYSYAVLKKDEQYKLLKLGMGRTLLTERELTELMCGDTNSSYAWNKKSARDNRQNIVVLQLLLTCISCGGVAVICGAVLVYKEIGKK